MCIICLSLENETITIEEAEEHLESAKEHLTKGHIIELTQMIGNKRPSIIVSPPLTDWSYDPLAVDCGMDVDDLWWPVD